MGDVVNLWKCPSGRGRWFQNNLWELWKSQKTVKLSLLWKDFKKIVTFRSNL